MRSISRHLAIACATAFLTLTLAACPLQASYQSTITPIYAATDEGLFVYNGSSWTATPYLSGKNITSVVVSGSGAGATVFAGTEANGIYRSSDSTWSTLPWTSGDGLGAGAVNSLYLSANLYAATVGGLSVYNFGGTWTNDLNMSLSNDLSFFGSFSYIARNSGLCIFNGTSQVSASPYAPGTVLTNSTTVNAVLVDSAQDIIAGTDYGLALLTYGSSSFTDLGLPGNTIVHHIFLDTYGILYAASDSGLFILGSSIYQALTGNHVYCVQVDGAGKIYAGTDDGVMISIDGGATWKTSLSGKKVNDLAITAPLYSF